MLSSTNTATSDDFRAENANLKETLNSLSESANDLSSVVALVESRRAEFPHISDEELKARRAFVKATNRTIRGMKTQMASSSTQSKLASDQKEELLSRKQMVVDAGGDSSRDAFVSSHAQTQELVREEQEDHLDAISSSLNTLQAVGTTIHEELEAQNNMLEELDDDMAITSTKMDGVLQRLDKMLKTNSKCQRNLIIFLCLLAVILIILVSV